MLFELMESRTLLREKPLLLREIEEEIKRSQNYAAVKVYSLTSFSSSFQNSWFHKGCVPVRRLRVKISSVCVQTLVRSSNNISLSRIR